MGFRCPICLKDFKQDKKAWQEHCKNEHIGVAKEIVKILKNIAEEKEEKDATNLR